MEKDFDKLPVDGGEHWNEEAEPDLNIDYLHPDGKPPNESAKTDCDSKPDLRHYRKAIEEADGHSMRKYDPFLHGPG